MSQLGKKITVSLKILEMLKKSCNIIIKGEEQKKKRERREKGKRTEQ